jgi:hypothetical protein
LAPCFLGPGSYGDAGGFVLGLVGLGVFRGGLKELEMIKTGLVANGADKD